MKILFVSGCAPATFNHGEPNSYPYYLIKEMARRHEVYVGYFSVNKQLGDQKIHSELQTAGVRLYKKLNPQPLLHIFSKGLYVARVAILKFFLLLRITPPATLIPLPFAVYKKRHAVGLREVISEFNPDLAIVFPLQLRFSIIAMRKLGIPVSLLCTDSLALHFERLMETQSPDLRTKTYQHYIQARELEKGYGRIEATYLFVGEKDKEAFQSYSKQGNCYFIPHHLYSYAKEEKNWSTSSQSLNVIFAGGGNTIYTGNEADNIAQKIAGYAGLDKRSLHFYFLGHGYELAISSLKNAGYAVTHQTWVSDYDEHMKHMHIQIFPIIMGTGTKAKVLAAMSSGLLCIGTWYSFENIQAEDKEHYLQYNKSEEVPQLLESIDSARAKFKEMSERGRSQVLEMHMTEKVVDKLLALSGKK
ncbi:MAG: hypothetical protein H7Y42_03985 [Chitinophagaceae bacterium]|nr:hypothetical protein [Chitinophagaceae bacterium]